MRKIRGQLAARVGFRLRELREKARFTQAALAEKAGLTAKYISEIENGHRDIRVATIERLAKSLKLNPAELLNFGPALQARTPEDSKELELTMSRLRGMLRERDDKVHQHVLHVVREVLRLLDAVS